MSDLDIRSARPDDVPGIIALVRAAYAPYVGRIGQEPAPMQADYATLVDEGVVFVLPGVGRLRAAIVMMPEANHLFLENIAVHPEEQGQGLGRQLMAWVDDQARALGLVAVELYTNELMTENLAFYPRLGYVEVDRRLDDGFRRVFMRKPLV
ncbi:MAG: GNAT family N-acetyltransferase [Dehalococcoidia bacterium]